MKSSRAIVSLLTVFALSLDSSLGVCAGGSAKVENSRTAHTESTELRSIDFADDLRSPSERVSPDVLTEDGQSNLSIADPNAFSHSSALVAAAGQDSTASDAPAIHFNVMPAVQAADRANASRVKSFSALKNFRNALLERFRSIANGAGLTAPLVAYGIFLPSHRLPPVLFDHLANYYQKQGLSLEKSSRRAELILPQGVRSDDMPEDISKKSQGPPTVLNIVLNAPEFDASNPGSPASLQAIEEAVKQRISENPERFGASASFGSLVDDLGPVQLSYDEATRDIIVLYRQVKVGRASSNSRPLLVSGASVGFHIKLIDGRPVLLFEEGQLADVNPEIIVARYSDAELTEKAQRALLSPDLRGDDVGTRFARSAFLLRARLRFPDALKVFRANPDSSITEMTRTVTREVDGSWRAVNIYQATDLKGNTVFILVDVHTGEAFVQSPESMRNIIKTPTLTARAPQVGGWQRAIRSVVATLSQNVLLQPESQTFRAPFQIVLNRQAGSKKFTVTLRGVGTQLAPDGDDHGPTGPMAMPNMEVKAQGQSSPTYTDTSGSVTIEVASADGPATLIIPLIVNGVGPIVDDDKTDPDLAVRASASSGQTITLNPEGTADTESLNAVINGAVYSALHSDFFESFLKMTDARVYMPFKVGVHVNGKEMVGNAFYSPFPDGFHLMMGGAVTQRIRVRDRRTGAIQTRDVEITFEPTDQPSILYHEKTHSTYQRMGLLLETFQKKLTSLGFDTRYIDWPLDPVVGPAPNEGGADSVSVIMRFVKTPKDYGGNRLGNGFMMKIRDITDPSNPREIPLPNPNLIRDVASELSPYTVARGDPHYDPHEDGVLIPHAAWYSLVGLEAALGGVDAARLHVGRIFGSRLLAAQALTTTSALVHAIISDMNPDGTLGHAYEFIRKAAAERGLELPEFQPPSKATPSQS